MEAIKTNIMLINNVMELGIAPMCFTFCVLATIVLIYYVRRRYCLRVEINAISREKLWYLCYQNHVKNLKIKAMISDFIIIIVVLEIINNALNFNLIALDFRKDKHRLLQIVLTHLAETSRLCYVPLLCILLQVLWLSYIHSPYKYTIMKWLAYIVFRYVALYIVFVWAFMYQSSYFIMFIEFLYMTVLQIFELLDLVCYLVYSRRFYTHLKSRELEAKFFMEKHNYFESRYLRIHFKVATILVASALVIYYFPGIISRILSIIVTSIPSESIEVLRDSDLIPILEALVLTPMNGSVLLYRILINFNYLYVFFVILYKYCKKKQNHGRINDKIKPLVRDYQDSIYSRKHYI